MACPIIREDDQIHYVRHEWKILQKAITTMREHGHKSTTGRAMIEWIHTSEPNIPVDCIELARLLLTPSQYLIRHQEWERLAREEENRRRDPADPLAGLRADMVTGSGQFFSVEEQVCYPQFLLDVVTRTAIRAYDAVPDSAGTPSFTAVRQSLTEPYHHFIDRLQNAIRGAPRLDQQIREKMFNLLAFENANAKTKSILATLPKTADVSDMVELVSRADQCQQAKYIAEAVAAAIQTTTSLVAEAVQRLSVSKNTNTPPSAICYRCGRKGHMRRTCTATVWCDRCQKDNHATTVCRGSKNQQLSAKNPRAKTQVGAVQHPTFQAPQPEAAWESIWQQQ